MREYLRTGWRRHPAPAKAYQIAKSRITCYDLASRHSQRRSQQGPSEVRIAVKAGQLNQNNDPEGREVVQACNSRLITGD